MSTLKLRTIPQFPSQVIGGTAITIEQVNGNDTVSVDYNKLALISPYSPQPGDLVLIWDAVNNQFFLAPAASFS